VNTSAEGFIMLELPDDIHEKITELCQAGDAFADVGDYVEALERYWAAWDLLPAPKTNWQAATWILAAIGDANYHGRDYAAGRDNLSMAMHCPEAIGNPFLHLRLGQCRFELNDLDAAADELARAYMGAGLDIFRNEDRKYVEFLKTRLKPPPGGW
jgi:tetratricopeptide (TPR) repeat protein